MKTAERVRRGYERRPYPFGNSKALTSLLWRLDLKWVSAMGRIDSSNDAPARVLVAGCGDGTEAFNLQRMLPQSEIVAVDFSARSISIARRLQRRAPELRRIRFVLGDLADRRLCSRLGEFDLITCQGVLSYVPNPGPVLKNLGLCLVPDGVLYAGVNGANHTSRLLRPALAKFGYDLNEYSDTRRLRGVLALCDTFVAADRRPRISGFGPAYLASDVFGALNQSRSLADWISRARWAGLQLLGNKAAMALFWRLAQDESYPLLIPWSRAQVCEFLELLCPSAFHQLLFSRKAQPAPPWQERGRLLLQRVALTRLYDIEFPKAGRRVLDRLRRLRITSVSMNVATEWRMPEWEMELLRGADGGRSLASQLRECPLSVPFAELRKQLYLLYQLGVINLLPARDGS
jgi:SAM-dependent methyltransferase